MYNFVAPDKMGYNHNEATEALIWNGKVLDRELVGFRTLAIDGREDLSYKITKLERPQHGDIETATAIASKTIRVRFLIQTDNSRDFNNTWYALKTLMQGSKQRFTFVDEQDTYRLGTVQSITNDRSGAYAVTGVIEIYQSDPFIYSPRKHTTINRDGNNPIVLVDTDLIIPHRPISIGAEFNIAVGAPVLTFVDSALNTRYTVQVTIPVKAGDRLTVNMDSGSVFLNGEMKQNALSVSSDIGNFKLSNGTMVDNSNSMLRSISLDYNAVRI